MGSPCSGPWLDKCGVTLFFRLLLLSILAVQTGCMWGHLVLGLGWTNGCMWGHLVLGLGWTNGCMWGHLVLDKCGVTLFFRLLLLSILAVQTGCTWGSPCSGPWLDKCGVTLFWALAGQMAACGVTLFWALAGQMAACGITLFFRLLLSILTIQTGCMWGHLVL